MIERKKAMTECKRCPHRKHARACRSCACAYRSTAAKPVKARNEKRRPAALATAQREAVIERSGGRCEMERAGETLWYRCPQRGSETAHLVRRRLCGDAIYDPAVVVFACTVCHNIFDHRTKPDLWEGVRAPKQMLARAVAAIKAAEETRAANGRAVVPLAPKHGGAE